MKATENFALHNPSEWQSLEDVVAWALEREAAADLYIVPDLLRVVAAIREEIGVLQYELDRERSLHDRHHGLGAGG